LRRGNPRLAGCTRGAAVGQYIRIFHDARHPSSLLLPLAAAPSAAAK